MLGLKAMGSDIVPETDSDGIGVGEARVLVMRLTAKKAAVRA